MCGVCLSRRFSGEKRLPGGAPHTTLAVLLLQGLLLCFGAGLCGRMRKGGFWPPSVLISILSISSWMVSLRQVLTIYIVNGMRWLGEIVQAGGVDKVLRRSHSSQRMA